MSHSEPYQLRSNDRGFLVGKTGSGKSAALQKLVWQPLSDAVYYDMTGDEAGHLQAPVLDDLDDVQTAMFPDDGDPLRKFVYSPEMPTLDGFDRLCRMCYDAGNTTLIADELMAVYRASGGGSRPTTDGHLRLLTNGRKRGAGFYGASQRPSNVPLEAISEAEHNFVFKLKLPKDRDRMAQVCGPAVKSALDLDHYHYYYDHDQLQEPQLCEPLDI